MNEPDTSGGPTAIAKERDETNETVVVPDAGLIQAAELAWSSDPETEDYDTPTVRHTWGATWSTAGVLLMCGAVLAGVIGISGWAWVQMNRAPSPTPQSTSVPDEPPPPAAPAPAPASTAEPSPTPSAPPSALPPTTVTVQAAPPPTVTVEAAPPPAAAATPAPRRSDRDEAFMATLRSDGIIITNPAEVIAGGHRACEYIVDGHTAHDAMRLAMTENPTLTLENASTLIGAAIGAYCPQYTGM
jgi:serine/threonine protein kinase, bacterial